jgi:hypothetical protein
VIEGVASQEDWSAIVVVDPVQETELLPVWETKICQNDGGWNTSLAKREYFCFVASGGIPTSSHGVRHVGIFVGTKLHFRFGENTIGVKLGFHGFGDGICGLVLGFHIHKEELNILI